MLLNFATLPLFSNTRLVIPSDDDTEDQKFKLIKRRIREVGHPCTPHPTTVCRNFHQRLSGSAIYTGTLVVPHAIGSGLGCCAELHATCTMNAKYRLREAVGFHTMLIRAMKKQ